MRKLFDKNAFKKCDKPVKIIIDTDPGVDDIACVIYAMNDENLDVKLISTVVGNISVDKSTRNILHVCDKFGWDVPVARGADQALMRVSPNAEFIHKAGGMGGYQPPESTIRKINHENSVEAMYKLISEGDGDIIPVMLGPVTNLAVLLLKHPEIAEKIPKVVIMGGAPFGNKHYPAHISFNLSSDPEAFDVVLNSKIPILMCPSHIGRIRAHLDEKFVHTIQGMGEVGAFLFEMYSDYWEPRYPTKRITTNDSCALFALIYPDIFKIRPVTVSVNTTDFPGRTEIDFVENSHIEFIDDVDRRSFLRLLYTELNEMKNIKLKF